MQKNRRKETSIVRKKIPMYVFAFSLLFLFFALFPDIDLRVSNPKEPTPLATIIEKDNNAELIGLDDIYDYSPLFITTRWNATHKPMKIVTPIAWDFETSNKERYASALENQNFIFGKNNKKYADSPIKPMILRNIFSNYARAEIPTKNITNGISFSLIDLSTGRSVKSEFVKCDFSEKMFAIAEYKVSIEKDGWAMRPLVMQSSGNEEVDNNLAKLLTKSKLLKQIPHGDYKATFVP